MSSPEPPDYLYRSYSRDSDRQLRSGRCMTEGMKGLTNPELLNDFRRHLDSSNERPTALVSTTSSLQRAVLIALQLSQGHRACDVHLVILSSIEAKIHSGVSLALGLKAQGLLWHNNPFLYESEWLFEWIIPYENVLHTISLQTLIERGFTMLKPIDLQHIPGDLAKFRKGFQSYWCNRNNTSSACASAATCFGFSAPTEMLAEDIYSWTLSKDSRGPAGLDLAQAIDIAHEAHKTLIIDNLNFYGSDRFYLCAALDCADESYIDNVGEIVATVSNAIDKEHALQKVWNQYSRTRQRLELQLADLETRIGY